VTTSPRILIHWSRNSQTKINNNRILSRRQSRHSYGAGHLDRQSSVQRPLLMCPNWPARSSGIYVVCCVWSSLLTFAVFGVMASKHCQSSASTDEHFLSLVFCIVQRTRLIGLRSSLNFTTSAVVITIPKRRFFGSVSSTRQVKFVGTRTTDMLLKLSPTDHDSTGTGLWRLRLVQQRSLRANDGQLNAA